MAAKKPAPTPTPGYVYGANAAPSDFPTASSYLPDLFNTGAAGNAPVLLRRGPTPGSPAQAQMAQTGQVATMKESTLTDVLAGFASLSNGGLIDLQKKLYAGGFYGAAYYDKHPRAPQYGNPDRDTLGAYSQAANLAAQLRQGDITLDDVLARGAAAFASAGGPGSTAPKRAPLSIRLTNPTDISSVVNHTVQQLAGRNATAAEIAGITKAFQGAQRSAQTAQYGAEGAGGTSTAAPNLDAFAEQQIRAGAPNEIAAHDIGNSFDTILGLLKSPV